MNPPETTTNQTAEILPGRLLADDFASLQEAVDALGEEGGVILLSGRTYELDQPLLIRRKVVLQGVMDAKAAFSSTKIVPASDFTGDWLIETVPQDATVNPDLNADFGIYDLVMVGTPEIGGILGTNIDVIRIERSRLAYMYRCLDITQKTDLPRPYPSGIVPGGVFINNSIFQATDVCLNLEYSTQNRIYANWFVSHSSVALRLLNSNKTWFIANEVNQFKRAAILLEDDQGGGNYVHNVIVANNWIHGPRSDTKFVEAVNPENMNNIHFSNNIMEGPAGIDLPLQNDRPGNVFRGNGGSGNKTEASGTAVVPAGQERVRVTHGLIVAPAHVGATPQGRAAGYWIEAVTADTFDLFIDESGSSDLTFTWEAVVQR